MHTSTGSRFYKIILSFIFLVTGASAQVQPISDSLWNDLSANLPFAMPRVAVPEIPSFSVSIKDFGAVGDGLTMNTDAIKKAIGACVQKGGGRVNIPAGLWLSGPFQLASNIELHLETGALLLFSGNIDDFPIFARPKSTNYRHQSPICGIKLHDIAITGSGVIDGNGQYWRPVKKEKLTASQWKKLIAWKGVVSPDGKMWWPSADAMHGEEFIKKLKKEKKTFNPEEFLPAGEYLRSPLVDLYGCKRVLLDGTVYTNPAAWTITITQCEDLIVRNVTVNNEWWTQNSDGFDISSCKKVLLYKNVVSAGDDAICIKPSSPAKKGEISSENILIADCTVFHGHGGLVIGSESYGGARNIMTKNLTCIGTDVGIRFKSVRGRGGLIENVFVDGVQMKDIENEAIGFDMFYNGDLTVDVSDKSRIPHFKDFHIQHVRCDGASAAVVMRGMTDPPLENITISDASFTTDRAFSIEDARGVKLENVRLDIKKGPVLFVKNSENISLSNILCVHEAPVFVHVEGERSHTIRVQKKDAAKAKLDVEIGTGAEAGSVVLQ
jgi:polygalacturonase